ncbi:YqiA/YcfP family alpha/beta fold hydrolase [Ketobacter sp.]|uniref:YqiA/YcfP family alpha/beta fold hydrolase n=1 Tax=Ketobacter sp. TaxID=2083498 RepID=UPI000F2DA6B5|nr:YqiA/YcfP family alpha/beta fold hydrolase [Ketobacter sp.]RLU01376.1 MAG: esterase [Ketobacter sp.]
MPTPFHLFYIHGFNSSPQSAKARILGEAVASMPGVQLHVPGLPYDPQRSIDILKSAVEACLPQPVGLVGSSMGGFYGTWLAEHYDLPLVLVNPAIRPYELLKDYLGINENLYTGERYEFTEQHIDVLRQLDVPVITRPQRYFLLTQTADEVLDYRQGVEKFAASQQTVEPGGSHGFDHFERHLPAIFSFFNITSE